METYTKHTRFCLICNYVSRCGRLATTSSKLWGFMVFLALTHTYAASQDY